MPAAASATAGRDRRFVPAGREQRAAAIDDGFERRDEACRGAMTLRPCRCGHALAAIAAARSPQRALAVLRVLGWTRANGTTSPRRKPGDSGSHAFPGAMRCGLEPGNCGPSSGMDGGMVFMLEVPGFPPGASWTGAEPTSVSKESSNTVRTWIPAAALSCRATRRNIKSVSRENMRRSIGNRSAFPRLTPPASSNETPTPRISRAGILRRCLAASFAQGSPPGAAIGFAAAETPWGSRSRRSRCRRVLE